MSSVILSNIKYYGCANMPEADGATVGGAVDFTKKVTFSDLAANGTFNWVSSSASDTATKGNMSFRDAAGVVQTAGAVTLTGTTPVAASATTAERLIAAVISGGAIAGLADPTGTAAVGDVALISNTKVLSARTAQAAAAETGTAPAQITLQSGDGASVSVGMIIRITNNTPSGANNQLREIIAVSGDVVQVNRDWGTVPSSSTTYDVHRGMLFDILPQPIKAVTRAFATSAADVAGGSSRTFYEKVFISNQNTTPTSLQGVQVTAQAVSPALPGAAAIDIATCKALNDTATAANRQTLPANGDASALTFTSGSLPQSQNMAANSQVLPGNGGAANAEAVWLRQTLPAGVAAYKGAFTLRVGGTTT